MKKKIIIPVLSVGLILIALIAFLIFNSLKSMDEAEIKFTFDSVRNGEVSKNGEYLLSLADKTTHQFFEKVFNDVLELDSISLSKKELFYQIMILSMRGQISKDEIRNMSGDKLFIHYFNTISNIPSVIKDRELVNIKVEGDAATAEMNSKAFPFKRKVVVKFSREDGWKYDFSSYLKNNEYSINKVREDSNKPLEQYLGNVMKAKGISQNIIELYKPINKNGD